MQVQGSHPFWPYNPWRVRTVMLVLVSFSTGMSPEELMARVNVSREGSVEMACQAVWLSAVQAGALQGGPQLEFNADHGCLVLGMLGPQAHWAHLWILLHAPLAHA